MVEPLQIVAARGCAQQQPVRALERRESQRAVPGEYVRERWRFQRHEYLDVPCAGSGSERECEQSADQETPSQVRNRTVNGRLGSTGGRIGGALGKRRAWLDCA